MKMIILSLFLTGFESKNSSVARKIPRRMLNFFWGGGGGGFVKRFSEFAKGIYEKCDRQFFNLAIIIVVAVFSVVQLIFYFYVC